MLLLYDKQGFISVSFLLVLVETTARFDSHIPSVDIVGQQRTGTVLGISQITVQDLHDEKTGVESNEVGQGERTHGNIGA